MPYANNFVKISAIGHFGSSGTNIVERWSAGFHLTGNGTTSIDPTTIPGFLTAIAPAVSTYHSNAYTSAGSACFLDQLTGALIGTNGRYVLGSLQATSVYTYGTPVAGVGTTVHPFSSACVITLRSLRLRGPASHGRVYWPALQMAVGASTGVLAPTQQSNLAGAAKTLFDTVNTQAVLAFGTGWGLGLVSNVGTGFEARVNKVGIGARLDAMESRERDLPEAHVFANLAVSSTLQDDYDDELRSQLNKLEPESPTTV